MIGETLPNRAGKQSFTPPDARSYEIAAHADSFDKSTCSTWFRFDVQFCSILMGCLRHERGLKLVHIFCTCFDTAWNDRTHSK